MKTNSGTLAAPFPWFGGKSGAAQTVWSAFGSVDNYVEPFAGSAAMLLAAPEGKRVETINDADGFVANFWRAIAHDPDAVAHAADWPCNEVDLFARHGWLVRQTATLTERLHADPGWFDARIAGWWCWGACNWIGSGWCAGVGPWVHDGEKIVRLSRGKDNGGLGVWAQSPHLGDAEGGDQRRQGGGDGVRAAEAGRDDVGVGTDLPLQVQAWCADNGADKQLRIVLCGHAGEHDGLLPHGWHTRVWVARKGYALSDEAVGNSKSETIWCSPHCVPALAEFDLFSQEAA